MSLPESEIVVDRKPFAPLPTALFIVCILAIALPGLIFIAFSYFFIKFYNTSAFVTSTFWEHFHRNNIQILLTLITKTNTTSDQLILQSIIDIIIAVFIVWRLPSIARATRSELGLRKPTGHDIKMAFIGVAAAFVLTSLTGLFDQAITHHKIQQDTIKMFMHLSLSGQIIAAIAAIVVAPIAEELFFRGVIFNGLMAYMPKLAAIIFSGFIFGFAHMQPDIAPELAVTGMVFATVYDHTRCIWSNIMSHAMFNAISVIAIMVFHQSS